MAAFKNKDNGTWYVQFRYTDWKGERQQKLKRGFATKREALEWEREFLMEKQADVNMTFESFVALYEKDIKPKLKLNTWLTKESIIKKKILPYFANRKLSEITAKDIIRWQNEIRELRDCHGKPLSKTYLKTVHNQLSAIFNHAARFYGLNINPARQAGNMGAEERKEMERAFHIHKFSVYAKFLYTMLPKGGRDKVYVDDKVLLEYYRLEKDFEGGIQLESAPEGFRPITGEAGRKEKKRDPLTVIIDKINEKYGTNFTEMDKVLLQMENDYAAQDKWHSYAQNNDRKTFMLLFEKDFPNMAAARYEQNEDFFVKMFSDPDMMRQVMETVGTVLYERLRGQKE